MIGRRIALVVAVLMASAVAAYGAPKSAKPKPALKRVVMYTWALSTGGVSLDLINRKLACYLIRTNDKDVEQERRAQAEKGVRTFPRVSADLGADEVAGLRKIVERAGLRTFTPRNSDVRERRPWPDEEPPTLVLIWSDKTQVLSLPLHDTVRTSLTSTRKRAYEGMRKTCDYLDELLRKYNVKQHITLVPEAGPEYTAYQKERDKLTK